MATGRKMVITMLVTQHKAPMGPVTTVRYPIPMGEDPPKDTWSFHMYRAWGKAPSTHAVSMGFKHILKATGPSSKYLSNPRTRTLRKRRVVLSTVTNVHP